MSRFYVMCLWLCWPAWACSAPKAIELHMQVGEVLVLEQKQVERVAVGDGQVLNAVTTQELELILFARQAGSSGVQVWLDDGRSQRYQVQVAPENARQSLQELKSVLERIPHLRVSEAGGKLLLEGEQITDEDKERLSMLSQHYPQLLDFTSQIGWEPMVMLDVQVLELPRHTLRDLGVRWNPSAEGGMNIGAVWDSATHQVLERPAENLMPVAFPAKQAAAYFGVSSLLSSRLQLLAQEGYAVVLAQPQLLARSGAQAEFLAGGEVPYVSTDKQGNSQTIFKPYGVSLNITPRIERNGAVRARLEVEVSSVDPSVVSAAGPAMKTRRAATEFNVRSGQTLVLAGFISRELASNRDRLPGLGSLPVLGALFKSERYQRMETELAIFVTPTLVQADETALRQRTLQAQAIVDHYFDEPQLNTAVATATANAWSSSQWED